MNVAYIYTSPLRACILSKYVAVNTAMFNANKILIEHSLTVLQMEAVTITQEAVLLICTKELPDMSLDHHNLL